MDCTICCVNGDSSAVRIQGARVIPSAVGSAMFSVTGKEGADDKSVVVRQPSPLPPPASLIAFNEVLNASNAKPSRAGGTALGKVRAQIAEIKGIGEVYWMGQFDSWTWEDAKEKEGRLDGERP